MEFLDLLGYIWGVQIDKAKRNYLARVLLRGIGDCASIDEWSKEARGEVQPIREREEIVEEFGLLFVEMDVQIDDARFGRNRAWLILRMNNGRKLIS